MDDASRDLMTRLETDMARMTDNLGPVATVSEDLNSKRLKLTFNLKLYERKSVSIKIHSDKTLVVEGTRHTNAGVLHGDHHFVYQHRLPDEADVDNVKAEWQPRAKELIIRIPLNPGKE